jgi:hypothetical protein
MVATYSGDPSLSDRDAVRFLIQDTDTTSAHIQDEEIDWLLTEHSNVYGAAIMAAESVATNYAKASGSGQVKSKTVGALSISYTDLAKEYRSITASLRRRLALGIGSGFIPYAGGISVADKDTQRQDEDWDAPSFSRKLHDNYGTEVTHPELSSWST